MELRWYTEHHEEWSESASSYVPISSEKVLQYRTMINLMEIGLQEPMWSEWKDVEDVNEDV